MILKNEITWKNNPIYGLLKNNLNLYDKIKYIKFSYKDTKTSFKLLRWTGYNSHGEELLIPCDYDSSLIEKFIDDKIHQDLINKNTVINKYDALYFFYRREFDRELIRD